MSIKFISNTIQKADNLFEMICINTSLLNVRALNARKIPTDTKKNELYVLFRLSAACPPNSNALEIGSYLGASTCYIVAGLAQKKGHLFCADTWNNETMPEGMRDTYAEFLSNTANLKQWITPVRKRSSELVATDIKVPLSFVFIDAAHDYESVKSDFQNIQKWLSIDCVVVFHDSRWFEGVTRVIGEALASGNWIIGGNCDNMCWIKRAKIPRFYFSVDDSTICSHNSVR